VPESTLESAREEVEAAELMYLSALQGAELWGTVDARGKAFAEWLDNSGGAIIRSCSSCWRLSAVTP
jgi:hypothetical protein